MQVIKIYVDYVRKRLTEGKHFFVFKGGRRSGKTVFVCQRLLLLCANKPGTIVNVASMTKEQGRLGAYADMVNIIRNEDWLMYCVGESNILSSPREIRFKNGSKIFFNSYDNPETAKGIACDFAFFNEANNFSKQQYIDIIANVRRGVYIDFNPMCNFWVNDYFADDEILTTTWKDNPFLTPIQREYFEELKKQAEKPDANPVDIRNYNVYYLGNYSELRGRIFFRENFKYLDAAPDGLTHFVVFCDPSAIRGADWFACCLTARDNNGNVYLVDTFSINTGTPEMIHYKLIDWCKTYDNVIVYAETNGWIGEQFRDNAIKSGLDIRPWRSTINKFERIVANYHNFQNNLYLCKHALLETFMEQVFDFDVKCEHDDNVDALSTSYDIQTNKYGFTG